jgi:hypothetical protein
LKVWGASYQLNSHRTYTRALDRDKAKGLPYLEPKAFIQADRSLIVTSNMQEWRIPAGFDISAQDIHEATSKTLTSIFFAHTDSAYFDVSVDVHPLTCHRDELAPVPDSDVVTHLVCAPCERARFGLCRKFEHLFGIEVVQAQYRRMPRIVATI